MHGAALGRFHALKSITAPDKLCRNFSVSCAFLGSGMENTDNLTWVFGLSFHLPFFSLCGLFSRLISGLLECLEEIQLRNNPRLYTKDQSSAGLTGQGSFRVYFLLKYTNVKVGMT